MLRSYPVAFALTVILAAACGRPPQPQAGSPAPPTPVQPAAKPAAQAQDDPAGRPAGPPPARTKVVIPDSPQPRPASVVGLAVIGSPVADLGRLGAFLDQARPGSGAMFSPSGLVSLASILRLPPPDGIDLTRPVSVVVLDPTEFPQPVVIVVTVKDHGKLSGALAGTPDLRMVEHEGFAAIGSADGLEEAAVYGLTSLARQSPPPHPIASVFPAELAGRYEQRIKQLATQAGADPIATFSVEQLVEFARQTLRIDSRFVVGLGEASIRMTAIAVPGSTAARVYAGQKPSNFRLLAAVASTAGPMLASGRFDYGELKPVLQRMSALATDDFYSESLDPARFAEWFDAMGDEFALSMTFSPGQNPPLETTMVLAATNARAARKMLSALERGDSKASVMTRRTRNKLRYRGVTLSEFRTTVNPGANAQQRLMYSGGWSMYAGTLGRHYLAAAGGSARANAKQLIGGMKAGKRSALSSELASEVKRSTGLRETMLLLFDLATITNAGQPGYVSGGLSFEQDRMHLRFTAEAATLNRMMK